MTDLSSEGIRKWCVEQAIELQRIAVQENRPTDPTVKIAASLEDFVLNGTPKAPA